MRRLLILLLPVLLLLPVAPAAHAGPTGDPARWTDRQLAAQLLLAGYDLRRTDDALPWVREGLGGVVLFGSPPSDLRSRLARLRAAGRVVPLVASDEEGGSVQRLRTLLGRLPSAETMGRTRTPAQVRALAASYGAGMRRLGVDLDLAPVADLAVPGRYMEQTDRAFSASPQRAGEWASAFALGLRASGVASVAKHWPGHGSAANTHDRAASTPPLSTLEQRDLVPFTTLLKTGQVPAVMVGHLTVPGLTEPGTPATLSPSAYRYLRRQAGPGRLLVTDSLSMGAIRRGAGLTPARAAVRALRAGADAVLVDPGDGPRAVVDAVAAALRSGSYRRSAAVASARRVLALKAGLNAPAPLRSLQPAGGTAGASLTPTLSAVATDPVAQSLTVSYWVREPGASRWAVQGAKVVVGSGARASLRVPSGRLLPGTTYVWTARACTAGGLCSPTTEEQRFTTRTAPSTATGTVTTAR